VTFGPERQRREVDNLGKDEMLLCARRYAVLRGNRLPFRDQNPYAAMQSVA